MWNSELFSNIVGQAAQKQMRICGIRCGSKRAVYQALANYLNLSKATVESWARKKNRGPSSNEDYEKVQEIFGISFDDENSGIEKGKILGGERTMICSDFTKQKIFECYELMREFLTTKDVQDENEFSNMCTKIDNNCIAIPNSIRRDIHRFIADQFEPLVYDAENSFSEMLKYGAEKDGIFVVTKGKETEFMASYYKKIYEVDQKLISFAEENLTPILLCN